MMAIGCWCERSVVCASLSVIAAMCGVGNRERGGFLFLCEYSHHVSIRLQHALSLPHTLLRQRVPVPPFTRFTIGCP